MHLAMIDASFQAEDRIGLAIYIQDPCFLICSKICPHFFQRGAQQPEEEEKRKRKIVAENSTRRRSFIANFCGQF